MTTYFEVLVSKTCRERGGRHEAGDGFRRYQDDRLTFKTAEELQRWLDSEYAGCSRTKLYRDTQAGTEHRGYVYSLISPGVRDCPGGYYEQHWVTINRVQSEAFIARAARRRVK